jgi:ribose transport system substrate-binding protein
MLTPSEENLSMAKIATMLVLIAVAAALAVGAGAATRANGTIGFAQANVGNGWYEVQIQGVKDETKKLGFSADVVSGGGDPVVQNGQIQTFLTKQVKGIVLNGTDPGAIKPSIDAMKAANVPFVLVNTPLPPALSSQAYCYVSDDQVLSASKVGAEMARVLKKKYGSSATVKTLLVEGIPGDLNAVQRHDGWLKGYKSVAGAPKLKLLPSVFGYWSADKALGPVRAVATANPDLQAVFVETDSMMPAVQTALTAAGTWKKVVVGSFDGRMNIVKYMIDHPTGPIFATVPNQPYAQGTIAVDLLKKALAGVPKSTACPGGKHVITGPPITPANAKSFYTSKRDY